jgi:hypothetical protein
MKINAAFRRHGFTEKEATFHFFCGCARFSRIQIPSIDL